MSEASGTKWSLGGTRRYDPPALPSGMPRRLLLAALAAALLAFLIAAPAALGDTFTPESGGSQNADDIDTLFKITLYVGIVIFLIVEGTLLSALFKYRGRRTGPEAAQIRGNTPLELGWTMGAALILVVLTVVTFLYLDDIENPPPSGPNGVVMAARSFTISTRGARVPGGARSSRRPPSRARRPGSPRAPSAGPCRSARARSPGG